VLLKSLVVYVVFSSFTVKYLNNGEDCQLSLLELILYIYDNFCVTEINYEKKGLDDDGQQFHRYQQNEQSTFTASHWTTIYNIKVGADYIPELGFFLSRFWEQIS